MVLFPPPFYFVFYISNLLSYIQNNFSYELARPIMGTIFLVYIYYAVGIDLVTPSSDELAGVATVPPGMMPSEAAAGISWDILAGYSGRTVGRHRTRSGGSRRFIREGSRSLHGGGAPGRLVDRIRRWEYIEMCELLPELLADQKGGDGAGKQMSRAKGRKRVQEIAVWLQCFAVFVGGGGKV